MAAARLLVEQGCSEIVAVSPGPRGALLVTMEAECFRAIPVSAKSTVGADDSMLAGIIFGLTRGLRDAVQFGIAAGALALLGSGTQLYRRRMLSGSTKPRGWATGKRRSTRMSVRIAINGFARTGRLLLWHSWRAVGTISFRLPSMI
jgi:pfkB family carbohydrate kinase